MSNSSRLVIRDATLADAATIVDFNRRLALESEGKRLDIDTLALGVERALGDRALCRYFIAERDGRIIAQTMITYEWSDWRNGMFWWIQSVYVETDCRSQGVFRSLYQHIEALARATQGICGLRLYVEEHNAPALATYQRLGMRPGGYLVYECDWTGPAR